MMGEKSVALRLLSWVHALLVFEGFYVLFAGVWHIRGQGTAVFLLHGLTLIFPVVLTDLVLRRCKSLGIFCLFSAALVWAMHFLFGSMLTAGFTAFICLFRCYVKLKQGAVRRQMREMPGEEGAQESAQMWEIPTLLDSPRLVHCLLFAAIYLAAVALRRQELLGVMSALLGAELCVCLAYCYLERLLEFAKKNRYVANLPVKAMKRTGAGILGVGVIVLLLFMLPAVIYHEEPLTRLRLAQQQIENVDGEELYEENPGHDYMMEELMRIKASAKETPAWMKTASNLVCVLILLWAAYLALRMVFFAVRRAGEAFSEDEEDEVIFLENGEEADESSRDKKGLPKKERWLSPDRKIRRRYKRAVKRRLKGNMRGSETPFELENMAGFYLAAGMLDHETLNHRELYHEALNHRELYHGAFYNESLKKHDVYAVHELYEKARYAKAECTKEEVKQCMHIFSNFDR